MLLPPETMGFRNVSPSAEGAAESIGRDGVKGSNFTLFVSGSASMGSLCILGLMSHITPFIKLPVGLRLTKCTSLKIKQIYYMRTT